MSAEIEGNAPTGTPDTPWQFLILGPAGSGHSTALEQLGSFGAIQMEALPLEQHDVIIQTLRTQHPRLAYTLKIDPHQASPESLLKTLTALGNIFPELNLLMLDAPVETLVQRYQTANKAHRFEQNSLQQTLALEKQLYDSLHAPLKTQFGKRFFSIHTTALTPQELQQKLAKVLGIPVQETPLTVMIQSFGFKNGVPTDADMIFDMRFLKNPFYVDALKPLTGLDKPVQDYLFSLPATEPFLKSWGQLFQAILPSYQAEGKHRLRIGVGCTGGQHRSVCMAETLAKSLRNAYPEYNIVVTHRDMPKSGSHSDISPREHSLPKG